MCSVCFVCVSVCVFECCVFCLSLGKGSFNFLDGVCYLFNWLVAGTEHWVGQVGSGLVSSMGSLLHGQHRGKRQIRPKLSSWGNR